MGLGGNIEMWDPLERALNGRGIQTIAYDASGTGHSPTRLVPQRMPGARPPGGAPARRPRPSRPPTCSACPSAAPWPRSSRWATRTGCAGWCSPSTSCGLGGVPGNPLAMSLLATPLRYYSPAFLRLTAGVLYGPTISGKEDLLRAQINARRARPPSLWGYASQLVAGAGWTSLPWLGRIAAPTLVLAGDRDPIVPARNARILARRIPSARLELVHGAGHLLLLDQAEHCAALIAAFIGAR